MIFWVLLSFGTCIYIAIGGFLTLFEMTMEEITNPLPVWRRYIYILIWLPRIVWIYFRKTS